MAMLETEKGLYLSPELAGTLMTPEEFDSAEDCDDLYVYELINGVLVVRPPPDAGERGPNDVLGYLLRAYRERHPQGAALDETLPENLVRTQQNRRRADRVIWAGLGRTPRAKRDLPNIAIEFVSEAKRDRHRDYVAKREEYLTAGLQEYWIIDRFQRQMTVIRRDQPDMLVREPDVYRTPLLPGFELPLARLLSVADELKRADEDDAE